MRFWGVSNSYNRDLVRKEKRKAQYRKAAALMKEEENKYNLSQLKKTIEKLTEDKNELNRQFELSKFTSKAKSIHLNWEK